MANEFMVKVRPATSVRTILEVRNTMPARSIDSFAFLERNERKYTNGGMVRPIGEFGAYSFVEVETGFEEEEGTSTVVYVDPGNAHLPEVKRH